MNGAVIIVGAGSGIGKAIGGRLAAAGRSIVLVGRRLDELERDASDLEIRLRAKVRTLQLDVLDFEGHGALIERCESCIEEPVEGIVVCVGLMPDEPDMRRDSQLLRCMIESNYTAIVSILEAVAPALERRRAGFICGISSVAGDRGRASNYLYGSSKAALSTYLAGLRARLARSGIRVVTVKPGFVDTNLTWGRPGIFLVASPDRVARDVLRGIERNRAVVYTPWFWRWILRIIRTIPDPVFNRLKL